MEDTSYYQKKYATYKTKYQAATHHGGAAASSEGCSYVKGVTGVYYKINCHQTNAAGQVMGSIRIGPKAEAASKLESAPVLETLIQEPVVKAPHKELYNPENVFQFYSKSRGLKPGKGAGESLSEKDKEKFADLEGIKDWRKKLSNFWSAPFELDGKLWDSVEHYYQGSKYKNENPHVYDEFSLDSGSELSKNAAMAKGAGGKKGSYRGARIIPKGVTIDRDFFTGRSEREMKAAQYAKFTQNDEMRQLLKATQDAKLQHFSRGSDPIEFTDLMRIRRELN